MSNWDLKLKLEKLSLGEKAYQNAIQLVPSLPSLHYDLGTNYFYQSKTTTDQSSKNLEKAQLCFKKAIVLQSASKSDNSLFWNALGVVIEKPQYQQHAFLKALNFDGKVAEHMEAS